MGVNRTIIHPKYSFKNKQNDIALLRLTNTVELNGKYFCFNMIEKIEFIIRYFKKK